MTKNSTEKSQPPSGAQMFQRGLPLVIRHGQVDDSLIQVSDFISGLFKHFEHEGKVPVQASIEIKVIVLDE